MAAEQKTETNFNIVGEVPVEASVTTTTQNDWVILPHAGALHVIGTNFYDGGMEATAVTHPTITVDLGAGYDEDATSIVYENGAANQRTAGGWYGKIDATSEIIYVQVDSGYADATGTLTVKRGALGTTPAAITDGDVIYVLNTLIFTSSHVGTHLFRYTPIPNDPRTNYYG